MSTTDLYVAAIRRSDTDLRRALEDLSTDELQNQPAGQESNPIGWLVWHLTRTRDNISASIVGETSIWESGGWGARFGMAGELPMFAPADVHLFDPKDFATLVGYFDAVAEKSLAIIEGLTEADMDRVVESTIPGRPPQPTTQRLAVILNDNIQHVGQVAYLRGLIRGHGWY
jgi:hypothetical protein